MLDRSVEFQSMPPTYFMIAWVARRVGGISEIALRVPSVIAMALATYLLYRLGRRLFDAETGLIAAVVLATTNSGRISPRMRVPTRSGSLPSSRRHCHSSAGSMTAGPGTDWPM